MIRKMTIKDLQLMVQNPYKLDQGCLDMWDPFQYPLSTAPIQYPLLTAPYWTFTFVFIDLLSRQMFHLQCWTEL